MREVALYDAKNGLSALVQEVEDTGEEIVITRHGKPAARLAPVTRTPTLEERQEALRQLAELRVREGERARDLPRVAWEDLKREMRDEDKIDEWLS